MSEPSGSSEKNADGESSYPSKEDVTQRTAREADRGRLAESPTQVGKKGWLDVVWRAKRQVSKDNLSILAAGVAYYSFVAMVPALAVLIALYGLFANPAEVSHHLNLLSRVAPQAVMPLLQDQLTRITKNNTAAGISAVVGVVIALYSSASAMKALIVGMNVAYEEQEKRGFFKLNLVAIVLTFCGIVGMIIAIAVLTVVPSLLRDLDFQAKWVAWLRWPGLFVLFAFGVAVLYRFGPSRKKPQWRWISWGAFFSGLLWVAGSAGFSYYTTKFGRYEKTYGSLGAVVVFLLWFYLTAYVVLLGAELNSQAERQTVKDTTEGHPKELGHRGAFSADTVGPSVKSKDPA